MTRSPEQHTGSHLRNKAVAIAAASALLVAGCAKEGHKPDAKLNGCFTTPTSRADARQLRPELSGAVEAALQIYSDVSHDKPLPYVSRQQVYTDTRSVPVPQERATISVEIQATQPKPTLDSLREISTTLTDDKTGIVRMGQLVSHHVAGDWSFNTGYLTKYTNNNTYKSTYYEATPGSYGCAWSVETDSHESHSTGATMQHNPDDAMKIANEAASRMLVLTGTMQHLTPGATEYQLPDISNQFFTASHTVQPGRTVNP